jgi:hypothetical protein
LTSGDQPSGLTLLTPEQLSEQPPT